MPTSGPPNPEKKVNYTQLLFENATEDVFRIRDLLLQSFAGYLTQADLYEVSEAFDTAYYYHAVTTEAVVGIRWRRTKSENGEFQEYMIHPAAVAKILADEKCDKETIEAALLHDTREDTQIEDAEIFKQIWSGSIQIS